MSYSQKGEEQHNTVNLTGTHTVYCKETSPDLKHIELYNPQIQTAGLSGLIS